MTSGRVFTCLAAVLFAASCHSGGPDGLPPEIDFGPGEPVRTVKQGAELVITPSVAHAGADAVFTWTSDGVRIGCEPALVFSSGEPGSFYVSLRVENRFGVDTGELRIDVAPAAAPGIVMPVPEGGFTVVEGGELEFRPTVTGGVTGFTWAVDGHVAGRDKDFLFRAGEAGRRLLAFTATGAEGSETLEFEVAVCAAGDMLPVWLFESDTYNLSLGRTVFIRPYMVENHFDATYVWSVDGAEAQRGPSRMLAFTPQAEGSYTVTVTMINGHRQASRTFSVNVCPPEGAFRRPASAASVAEADHAYRYLPGPSQFVNWGASPLALRSQAEVDAYVYDNPAPTEYAGTLGAFGGCLTVGFDHSVANSGGYDIEIEGNAFPGSSEPGIVWVMQDENGDGQPNDTWYELRGSAYGQEGYLKDYAVTYYRGRDGRAVAWTDNCGGSGAVDYLMSHTPATIYPRWIGAPSYTLVGSRLPSLVAETSPGYWVCGDHQWGYADNYSAQDMLRGDSNPSAGPAANHFRISDAVRYDGLPAGLQYIDFVKIQTAVNAKAGRLGEISTEVMAIRDHNMRY